LVQSVLGAEVGAPEVGGQRSEVGDIRRLRRFSQIKKNSREYGVCSRESGTEVRGRFMMPIERAIENCQLQSLGP